MIDLKKKHSPFAERVLERFSVGDRICLFVSDEDRKKGKPKTGEIIEFYSYVVLIRLDVGYSIAPVYQDVLPAVNLSRTPADFSAVFSENDLAEALENAEKEIEKEAV